MLSFTLQQKLHYTLRFAIAMCFIGHGAFGLITKPIWCNYFAVFGIGRVMAYHLMPVVGILDILMGILMLLYPLRIIPIWLVVWGLFTALLRPLSGEPFAEFIERAGNFGAPLALLLLSGGVKSNIKSLFTPITVDSKPNDNAIANVITCLKFIVFLLLIGHGWLNLMHKKGFLNQYAMLSFSNPGKTAQFIGLLEIIAGIMVLIKPIRPILIIFLVWKITSELLYPHYEVFEWIERGGSYGAILALWFALGVEIKTTSLFKKVAM